MQAQSRGDEAALTSEGKEKFRRNKEKRGEKSATAQMTQNQFEKIKVLQKIQPRRRVLVAHEEKKSYTRSVGAQIFH
jgi:hypothetical protein